VQTQVTEGRGVLCFSGFALSPDDASLRCGAREIEIRPKSFAVLQYLAEHAGRVVSKDELMRAVWRNAVVTDDSLVQCVRDIRLALDDPSGKLVRTLPRRGYLFAASVTERSPASPPAARPSMSVVVLPFLNLGGDPDQEYFADGLTEDLTSDLSNIAGSFVIGRGTAFAFKSSGADVRQIARELGVRYVLQGSVRRSASRVRVNAQLIDGESGSQIWTERFDRERADLLEVQDEITGRIARALDLELHVAEGRRSERERPENPDATDLALRGWAAVHTQFSAERYAAARRLFEQALALDSGNASAQAGLAWAVAHAYLAGFSGATVDQLPIAEDAANRVLSIGRYQAIAHHVKGWIARVRKRSAVALDEFEAAIAANRNFPNAYAQLGVLKTELDRPEETHALVTKAMRLSPRDPSFAIWISIDGLAAFHMQQDEAAIALLQKALGTGPRLAYEYAYLASALALCGRTDEGRNAFAEFERLFGPASIGRLRERAMSDHPAYLAQRERLFQGLRKLGLRE